MKTGTFPRLKIVGETFGARGCTSSCSCDPCDCNPCGCGSSYYGELMYPRWRVSGYHITSGEVQGCDISGLTILGLAQPVIEGDNAHWQEILLVDSRATHEQITALLTQLESHLESMPAEVGAYPHVLRAIYQVPLIYFKQNDERHLRVRFTPEEAICIRPGADDHRLRSWHYEGAMALRETMVE